MNRLGSIGATFAVSAVGLFVSFASLTGCQNFALLRSQSPEKAEGTDDFKTDVETPLIGDYVTFAGLNLVTLEGVGLVTGLDGTGGDPPPSVYRTRIYQEMKRRGVTNPNTILRSPNTALVIVRGYLPPLIRKGEHFDIEVRVPEGSQATSLNGGWLLETHLAEQAIVPGRGVLQGHVFAKAKGPILISTGEGDSEESLAGVLRRGRVLGGGASRKNRNLTIYIRSDFRSVRNARRIASRIGQRFHAYDSHGLKEPLAEAKTDQTILLKVPRRYRDNYPRYLQAIRNIPFRETAVARRLRMDRLREELRVPATAQRAALQLEAIGPESIPALRQALDNPDLESRFHPAMALAYLEQTDGLPVLAEAARVERAFRVYALAALAAVDDAESIILLRGLLDSSSNGPQQHEANSDSAELSYGAFRALWTLDRNDSFIRGESMNGQFTLHVLDTHGDPMVHMTRRRRAELVLFGANQAFLTPIAVRAGHRILVTAGPGSQSITVSRYEVGKPDQRKTVSTRVADVIRTAVEFGASYPDIAQMLIQANKQRNLVSRLEIDALPRAGRIYHRNRVAAGSLPKRVGRPGNAPNLFSTDWTRHESQESGLDEEPEESHGSESSGSGSATLADVRSTPVESSRESHRWLGILKMPRWPVPKNSEP